MTAAAKASADMVDYVEIRIAASGTASDVAEVAARLLRQIEYLRAAGASGLGLQHLVNAYEGARSAVAHYAGIAGTELDALDEAIRLHVDDLS